MKIENIIEKGLKNALLELYDCSVADNQIQIQNTRKDLEGDITVVVFPFLRFSKKSPEHTGEDIGKFLQEKVGFVDSFNVIKGFLNLEISKKYWIEILSEAFTNKEFGYYNTSLRMIECI